MYDNSLFKHFTIVTPDAEGQIITLEDAALAILNGHIIYVGHSVEDAQQHLAGSPYNTYDGHGKILAPAMANTHGHIAMTLLRNQADDCNLHDWLFNVIFPRETRLNQRNVYTGTQLGLAEMIRCGTGAAADMYYFGDSVARAALDAGFRVNLCCDVKKPGPDGSILMDGELLDSQLSSYHRHSSGLLRVSLLVHSVYLYDKSIYPELASLASAKSCPVQIHISETMREVEECISKYGCRPPRQLEIFGFFKTPTIAAHCVFLDDDDRRIFADHGVFVAHNASSNLKLGSGIADLPAMLSVGIPVTLGTDGAASNNNLDLYREMRLASLMTKGQRGDASALPARTLLDMATRAGHQALGFANAGRIDAGFLADLQIIDCHRPAMTPLGDPVSALVYSADSSFVESLMVNGRWLMYKHELKTIDEEKLLHEAAQEAAWLNAP